MKLERIINSKEDESTIKNRAMAYLESAGYRQKSLQPSLMYHRGSLFRSLTSFSPNKWKAEAIVQVTLSSDKTTNVLVRFNINTTGQWVRKKERDFWNSELNGLEIAMQNGEINPATYGTFPPVTEVFTILFIVATILYCIWGFLFAPLQNYKP